MAGEKIINWIFEFRLTKFTRMPGIFQPIGNVKLTNVSVVRLKKGGKRYEVAAYKNKIGEFRKNVEKDLDNVVQMQQVFSNVSRGEIARRDDLKKSFGTNEIEKIIVEILLRGDIQLGKQERAKELEAKFFEVVSIISSKCVNPETNKPHPTTVIMKALRASHISIDLSKNTKKQALDAIRKLNESNIIPITRAKMSVRINSEEKYISENESKITEFVDNLTLDDVEQNGEGGYLCTVEPGDFKKLSQLIKTITNGTGSLTIVSINSLESSGGEDL